MLKDIPKYLGQFALPPSAYRFPVTDVSLSDFLPVIMSVNYSLNCISLINSEVELLFTCLSTTHVSSGHLLDFVFLPILLLDYFWLLICRTPLHILDSN